MKDWEAAGWPRRPRNTRERERLRAGGPPPRPQETIVAAWRRAGWSRKPQTARERRLLRAGLPEPRRRDWHKLDPQKVPPCRTCGGIRFTLRKASGWKEGRRPLVRHCLDCQKRYMREWRARRAKEAG